MIYNTITNMSHNFNEDIIQETWVDVLSKMEHRPPASTVDDLRAKYEHVAGLLTVVYKRRLIDEFRRKKPIPLTDDIRVWYNDKYDHGSELVLTDHEKAALTFYFQLEEQEQPLSFAQRKMLSRYRKTTGFKLPVSRKRG